MQIKFGIREKLLVPPILGLVIIVSSILLILQPEQLSTKKEEFIKNQTKLVKTLGPSIIQNILSNDLAELHSVFENSIYIHENEWRYIELRDQDKNLLYPIFAVTPKPTDTLISIKITIEENDEIFGYITLYTDWEHEKNYEIKKIYQLNLFAITLFCFIGLFSFIIQTKWVHQPIIKLKNVTHQFSLGNYNVDLPQTSQDEIGLLTNSIEQMRDKIQVTMKDLVDNEKLQRAILDSVANAIITIDAKGKLLSFNPGAEKIFQYSKEEVISHNIKMLMPNHIAQEHDHYLEKYILSDISKAIGLQRELTAIRKNGEEFPIELTINAKIIDNKTIFTGVLRDITEQKKVDKLKNEFISTISHELRTPLTAIKGALDIITKGLNLDLPEQATSMLNICSRNVERLLTLINDILDFSKLESGELTFSIENFTADTLILDCIELNQEYAKTFNTEFLSTHIDKNITISVDKDRFTQVLSNLLSNAAKFSPANTPVEIYSEVKNEMLRISIKDYGKGIPTDFQKVIFQKFTQSSSGNTRQVGGTGLGLNISKMIIEKLGGTIGFDTIIGKQTIFYIELPIIKII